MVGCSEKRVGIARFVAGFVGDEPDLLHRVRAGAEVVEPEPPLGVGTGRWLLGVDGLPVLDRHIDIGERLVRLGVDDVTGQDRPGWRSVGKALFLVVMAIAWFADNTWREKKDKTNSARAPPARIVNPRVERSTCRKPGIAAPRTATATLSTVRIKTTKFGSRNGAFRTTRNPTSSTTSRAVVTTQIFSHRAG